MVFEVKGLTAAGKETLRCLFFHGPTMDGDLPSKAGRTELIKLGYAAREMGWNWLTSLGTTLAIEIGMGWAKESWQRQRREA